MSQRHDRPPPPHRSVGGDPASPSAARELVDFFTGLRKQRRWSQAELAERIGTTQSAISEFEGGRCEPRLSTLQRYARALGLLVDVRVVTAEVPDGAAVFSSRDQRSVDSPAPPPFADKRVARPPAISGP
jgi:transcriptional regulator with XRE-family HTH domain